MDLRREVDEYIKDTVDHSLGLPISMEALKKKLYTAEESQRRLREQNQSLVCRLKEKEKVIDLVRSEASMNAQTLKKFIEENQKLGGECEELVNQCKKWERECFLYHQDREALMDFGNETDQRAKEAESRVRELEEEVRKIIESEEDYLVDSVLRSSSLVSVVDESSRLGRVFLEANIEDETCQRLLRKWDELKPTTRKVVCLVSMVKRIEKEKECVIMNLAKAEEEVELVSEQNRELDRENRKLLRECTSSHGGGGGGGGSNNKSSKRKSPNMISSPIEKRIELSSQDFS